MEGRYSLDREIGRGGTGVVRLGHDQVLGRRVALKRLGLVPGVEEADEARAEREAHLSARLNHPNIVAVFDVVTDDATGDRWLVMEYVEGTTLERLVRERGRLAPDEAAPLLRQVADGLAAAHKAGMTHRDVKPSNILVDGSGTAKLGDFGIARLATDPSLTQTGMMTGSPSYLAPEVASGGRGDEASDVWSLGATAFHLLAGRPPYGEGGNPIAAMYQIVNDDPPRLPDAGWMAPLLEGTMTKDPARRWSMDEVREFLARPDRPVPEPVPEPVSTSPVDHNEHTRVLAALPAEPVGRGHDRSPRRPPGKALGALAAVLAVVLVAIGASYLTGRDTAPSGGAAAVDRPGTVTGVSLHPTVRGIESFIRDYVETVAQDPRAAWTMLTPKFQRESGGFEHYREFWEPASDGKVLSIDADPANLTVRYQVHFDNFDNGPGPTVLDLTFDHGRYRIDGEHSRGFVPAD